MDQECKRRQIVELIEETARPKGKSLPAKRITVYGDHAIVAEQVIIHTTRRRRSRH